MNKNGKVKIYSTSTCPHCKMAKNFMDEHKVDYELFNVGRDQEARQEMIKKSGQMGVPVIIIGDDVFVGFDPAEIKNKLGL